MIVYRKSGVSLIFKFMIELTSAIALLISSLYAPVSAVAQDVAYSCGLDIEKKAGDGNFPHYSVGEFFGWGTNVPRLTVVLNGKPKVVAASVLNDGLSGETDSDAVAHDEKIRTKGLSHKQIAECVLNTFVHPTKIKQSFKI